MARFDEDLAHLLGAFDAATHPDAAARLRRCRSVRDLDAVASTDGGWLESSVNPRLRLVKHGSGTFLVLSYDDGWGTTLVQRGFAR